MDRIDLHITVPRVSFLKLTNQKKIESSDTIKGRVQALREFQLERFISYAKVLTNSDMLSALVRQFCLLDGDSSQLMKEASNRLHLSTVPIFVF